MSDQQDRLAALRAFLDDIHEFGSDERLLSPAMVDQIMKRVQSIAAGVTAPLASQPTPAPLDVERLARAIRYTELRTQMEAQRLGAVPAESGPMPEWYLAYAADVARAYAQQDTPRQYGGASSNTAAPLTTFTKRGAQQDTPEDPT